jgi:hypothetical protein
MVRRVSDGSSFVRDSNCNGWRDRALTPRPVRAKDGFAARNVVLVHGLFADGSCWSEVIARLQAAGLNATAVQNPLTTLKDAVAEPDASWHGKMGRPCWWGHSFAGMIIRRRALVRRFPRSSMSRRALPMRSRNRFSWKLMSIASGS